MFLLEVHSEFILLQRQIHFYSITARAKWEKKIPKNKQYEKMLSEVSGSEHNQQVHSCHSLQKYFSPHSLILSKEKQKVLLPIYFNVKDDYYPYP